MATSAPLNNTSNTNNNEDHLELFSIIWVDDTDDHGNIEDAEQKLRPIINHFKRFHNVKDCQEYIEKKSKHDRLVLIIKVELARELVPSIHALRQISSIYVLYDNAEINDPWVQMSKKIKTIVIDVDELVSQIKSDHKMHMKEGEPLAINMFSTDKSVLKINGKFVFYQVLIDCLLRLKYNATEKDELISCLENEYKNNEYQLNLIREFQTSYSYKKALWWYTRDSFLYRTLNAALRRQDTSTILLYHLFISDIHRQLQYHQCKERVKVYRCQLMSTEELEEIKKYIGEFISMNSFLSTSNKRPVALFYMGDTSHQIDLERVLFEIDADPTVAASKPFADISSYSCFAEESEVLFMLGSIFRLDHVTRDDNNQIWTIRMTLCSDDEHHLKRVLTDMKNQNSIGETNLHTLGKVLWNMGRSDLAEKYYVRLIEKLPEDSPLLVTLYAELSKIASQRGDFNKSVQLHNKSLEIKEELEQKNIPNECTNNTDISLEMDSPLDINPSTVANLIDETVMNIKKAVVHVKANENQCKRLAERIDKIVLFLKSINDTDLKKLELRKSLTDFSIFIEECLAFITKFHDESLWFHNVFNNQNSKEQFKKLNERLLQCVINFHFNLELSEIFDEKQDKTDQENDLNYIQNKLDEIASMMTQEQKEQLRHLAGIEENVNQRRNSYRHHLSQSITAANETFKRKKTKNELPSFLQIPYYDLIQDECIGHGGFADVYRGRWISQDHEVAIKVIRIQYLADRVKQDFLKEISTMNQTRYEYILNMYGACIEPDKYALVVEYMSLGSLYDVLKQKTVEFTWSDRWLIAFQMTKGINYLHSLPPKPIIHRDIKSHNFLMTETARGFLVKIGDFGLAKVRHETSQQSKDGPIVGTLPWKAPELLKLGKHTEASDIYALAIVFWELATGCEPYADSDDTIIRAYVKDGDRLEIPTDVPEAFVEIITKSWAQEPTQRLTSQQILNLLKTHCDQSTILQTNAISIERLVVPQIQPPSTTETLTTTTDNDEERCPTTNTTIETPIITDEDVNEVYSTINSNHNSRYSDIEEDPNAMFMPISGYADKSLVSLEIAVEPLMGLIPDIQTYVYIAKKRCKQPADGLTTDESASIMLYTMSWEPVDKCLYMVLNKTLRTENRHDLKPWFLYLKLFLTALSCLPSQNITVYRGVRLDLSAMYKPGATVTWWGFSSCCASINILKSDAFLGTQGIRTLFVIDCYSGKDIHSQSYYPKEDEILIPAATQFKVQSYLKQGDDLHIIQLQEIQSQFPLLEPVSDKRRNVSLLLTAQSSTRSNTHPRQYNSLPSDLREQYIFLSYGSDDKPLANAIADLLTEAGESVWTEDMIHGHEETEIADAIENSSVVICFPTPAYQESNACRRELCYAEKKGKKIIPILTVPNWQPESWLGMTIASVPCFNWENIQHDDVQRKMPDLLQRLSNLATGNFSRTRVSMSRNFGSERRIPRNRSTID